jgi:hypothetical protein
MPVLSLVAMISPSLYAFHNLRSPSEVVKMVVQGGESSDEKGRAPETLIATNQLIYIDSASQSTPNLPASQLASHQSANLHQIYLLASLHHTSYPTCAESTS